MESKEEILFRADRSFRGAEMIGIALIFTCIALVLGFVASKFEANSITWIAIVAPAIFITVIAKGLTKGVINNRKIELILSTTGIQYGTKKLPWDKIGKIYPYGGINLKGKREYILCYSARKGITSGANTFPIDQRLSTKEFRSLCEDIERLILPEHPHLKIKKP